MLTGVGFRYESYGNQANTLSGMGKDQETAMVQST